MSFAASFHQNRMNWCLKALNTIHRLIFIAKLSSRSWLLPSFFLLTQLLSVWAEQMRNIDMKILPSVSSECQCCEILWGFSREPQWGRGEMGFHTAKKNKKNTQRRFREISVNSPLTAAHTRIETGHSKLQVSSFTLARTCQPPSHPGTIWLTDKSVFCQFFAK